jgi:hypothetical protein
VIVVPVEAAEGSLSSTAAGLVAPLTLLELLPSSGDDTNSECARPLVLARPLRTAVDVTLDYATSRYDLLLRRLTD